jgi:predicted kinase
VIVDAVFDRPAEREAVAALAAACGAAFRGVWLEAPVATLGGRIAARRDDPSDATPDILAAQARRDCGTITWRRLDARLAPETLRAMILAADGAGPAPDPA